MYDGRYMAYAAAKLPAFNNSFKVDLPESDGSPASKGNVFNITVSSPSLKSARWTACLALSPSPNAPN